MLKIHQMYNKKKNRNSVISPTPMWVYLKIDHRLNDRQRCGSSHSNVEVHDNFCIHLDY